MEQTIKQKSEFPSAIEKTGDLPEKESNSHVSHTWVNKEAMQGFTDKLSCGCKNAFRNCSKFYIEKKKSIRHYSLVVAAVLFVVALFQNFESSQIEFLFWGFTAPKIVLFFAMLAIGSVFGYWLRGRNIFSSRSQATNEDNPIDP